MANTSSTLLGAAGAAILSFCALAGAARADVVEEDAVACKAKSMAAQIDQLLTNKERRAYRRFVDARTKVGDCKPLKLRTDVKVEKHEGDLACVKTNGDKRCSWMVETALRITSERREPVREDYFACKSPLYLDTARKIMGENDQEAIKRFRIATSQSGECLTLKKGERVDVERRKDKIFCVRPPGEDECYWTDNQVLPSVITEAAGASTGSAVNAKRGRTVGRRRRLRKSK